MGDISDAVRFYDAVSEKFESEYYGDDGDTAIRSDVERFRRFLLRRAPETGVALEIGSGTGVWLDLLVRSRAEVVLVGIDISPAMCEVAHRAGHNVAIADAARLPIADSAVDLVLSPFCALDHVADFAAAFAEIDRVLKPGGQMTLMVDNSGRKIKTYWKVTHERVKSLPSDPNSTGEWLHEVDGEQVRVFTKMYSIREIRELLPNLDLEFIGLGYLTPLLRGRLRRGKLGRGLARVLGPLESCLGRLLPQHSALLMVAGQKIE